jgi:FMN phosphatase YigB (HAD superfamily)
MTIKQVYFDIADTLLYKPEVPKIIRELLMAKGICAGEEQIIRAHRACRELIPAPDKTGREFYLDFNARFLEVLGVYPDAGLVEDIYLGCRGLPWIPFDDVGVLDEIDLPVGVISNWDSSLAEKLNLFFPGRFSPVVVSSECGCAKPDPGIYLEAIKRSGVAPHEIVFVGDSIRLDIVPALDLGIRAILVDRMKLYSLFNYERIVHLSQLIKLISEDKRLS